MTDYTRRRLLTAGAAAATGVVAGCLDSGNTAEATPHGDGPVLETIALENLNSSSHSLDIIIQWDDEIEYWEEHELSAISDTGDSSRFLEDDWPTDPGEFQLTVRLDDGTLERFHSTEFPDRDCLSLVVLVSREGELSILTEVSGGACVDETDDAGDARDDLEDQ